MSDFRDIIFFYTVTITEEGPVSFQFIKACPESGNRGFSGTVSGRNLYVLSHTTPASVFVELGNIQNTFDQRRLVMNSNRQALAKWLMEGFLKDYKEKK